MSERQMKKMEQIKKIEKRIAKWEAQRNVESFIKRDANWIPYWISNNPEKTEQDYINAFYPRYENDVDYEIRSAKKDLETAKAQLERIKEMEAKKNDNDRILESMPKAITEFIIKITKAWNEYDERMRDKIFAEKRNASNKEERRQIVIKYGSLIDLTHKTLEDIHTENEKLAKAMAINLYKRVYDITGEITDAKGLKVNPSNSGYPIINGLVIGKEGKAMVESIGAGGYNIQRYHIRVLVKQY